MGNVEIVIIISFVIFVVIFIFIVFGIHSTQEDQRKKEEIIGSKEEKISLLIKKHNETCEFNKKNLKKEEIIELLTEQYENGSYCSFWRENKNKFYEEMGEEQIEYMRQSLSYDYKRYKNFSEKLSKTPNVAHCYYTLMWFKECPYLTGLQDKLKYLNKINGNYIEINNEVGVNVHNQISNYISTNFY